MKTASISRTRNPLSAPIEQVRQGAAAVVRCGRGVCEPGQPLKVRNNASAPAVRQDEREGFQVS